MCGVIGVSLTDVTPNQVELVRRVMQETQIRGKHAAGAVHHNGSGLVRITVGVPISRMSEEFMDWNEITKSGDLKMIAHARYSTSDMEFHQPLGNKNLFMAHNGVITQEPPETWEETYGYNFDTRNDSEILLKKLTSGYTPSDCINGLSGASAAVVTIDRDGVVSGWRNSLRPLWRTDFINGCIFTSTKDIMIRASGGTLSPIKLEVTGGSEDRQLR
jgi:glutamine phosphoribosylpyrophosphate amidotransferase